ncbi:MAG TPA: Fe-S oxidoreductase [Ruminococcaceae bacterium]|nr:Fe-S oxidoreductase [Oscillospiraceae bacterium]
MKEFDKYGVFSNAKKNFGFGCMRLPMKDGKVDYDEFKKMVDTYMSEGFNYFDTARVYLEGQSETAIGDCISKRYPRNSFVLTDKLSTSLFNKEEEIRPLFNKQLEACKVDYFDVYLMHAQSKSIFEKYKKYRAYEQALELKAAGKIKHMGISFHDTADVLDEILTEYPQVEVVQIQLNYVDFDDPAVQARKCADICKKHGKPIIVMEPVKGGNLVNLPEDAKKVLKELHGGSPASYAIRFAAGIDGVMMVLSGMSNLEQMPDNLSYMKDFKPLDETERAAVARVCEIFRSMHLIPCTACRYCTDGCPKHISIPDLFSCLNSKQIYHDWNADYYYSEVHTSEGRKASDCIKCGKCEKSCPQHLPIRKLLVDVAETFENNSEE